MAYDDYGSYVPGGGQAGGDYYTMAQQQPQLPMNNSTPQQTDPNQGWGVPNSYGLASQPNAAPAPTQNYNITGFQDQTPAWQQPSWSMQQADAANAAAIKTQMSPQGQPGPGTPIPGGSRSVSYGALPNVSQMGQPYAGGASSYVQNAQGQNGVMPTTLMDQYKAFLTGPDGMLNSPMFQAIKDQGLQATERAQLARGGNGGGGLQQELQKTGTGLAANYLTNLSDIYKGGAVTESGRYGVQASANQGAGQLGLSQYGAEAGSQMANARANYGAGQDQYAQVQAAQAQNPVQQLMTMLMQRQMQGY